MNLPTGFDQRFDSLRLVRELGSYSAAAQELNLSPSAIAQQIHALERELDALLFIRDGNRLLPTGVCEIAAEYAAQAASLRRRMELEIDASRREVSSLVVGVSPSLEDSAVSEMLARYMQHIGGALGREIAVFAVKEHEIESCGLERLRRVEIVDEHEASGRLSSPLLQAITSVTDNNNMYGMIFLIS